MVFHSRTQVKMVSASGATNWRGPWKDSLTEVSTNSNSTSMNPCSVPGTPLVARRATDHMTQIISAPSTMEKNMVSRCRVHIPSPILKCSRWCNTYADGVGPEAALKKFTIESSLNFFYRSEERRVGKECMYR